MEDMQYYIMGGSNAQNYTRNILWGLVNKVISLGMPFVIRTMLIYVLGIQYVGLDSLFTSVLGILSLAELGVGTAITYFMYAPVANNNIVLLSALLNLYRKIYRRIGLTMLIVGLMLLPFIDKLINGTCPSDINLHVLYIIFLLNTVLSYFLYAYKNALFSAYQRNDVRMNIASILNMFRYGIQIIILYLYPNYYLFIVVMLVNTMANNVVTNYFANKFYPDVKCDGDVSKKLKNDIVHRVKGLVMQKIGGVVLGSVDGVVISVFLGLSVLGIYNTYFMIISGLFSLLAVFELCVPTIGNAVLIKSVDENYKEYMKINMAYMWVVSWGAVTLYCLYQPFMTLWLGDSDLLLPNHIIVLLVIYFFVYKWMDVNYFYTEAAGLWYEMRYIPMLAAVVNLVINIILVQIIGLAGVLISTIVSLLLVYDIGGVWILFKVYFNRTPVKYLMRQLYYSVITVLAVMITSHICEMVQYDGIYGVVLKFSICCIVPNIIIMISLSRFDEFDLVVKFIGGLKKRLG